MLCVCFVIELKAWKFLNRISLQLKWNFLCMTSCQRIKIEINLLLSRLSSVCGQNMTFGDCLLLLYAEFITATHSFASRDKFITHNSIEIHALFEELNTFLKLIE